jgi:hypothetical protein
VTIAINYIAIGLLEGNYNEIAMFNNLLLIRIARKIETAKGIIHQSIPTDRQHMVIIKENDIVVLNVKVR